MTMGKKIICFIIYFCVTIAPSYGNGFVYDAHGKRDPFVPLTGAKKDMVAGMVKLEEVVSVDDIALEGIAVGDKGSRIAIINGEMVHERDVFGILEINSILDTGIEVSISGRKYSLSLKKE